VKRGIRRFCQKFSKVATTPFDVLWGVEMSTQQVTAERRRLHALSIAEKRDHQRFQPETPNRLENISGRCIGRAHAFLRSVESLEFVEGEMVRRVQRLSDYVKVGLVESDWA
jgi:hypothetical protein